MHSFLEMNKEEMTLYDVTPCDSYLFACVTCVVGLLMLTMQHIFFSTSFQYISYSILKVQ